mgnify:CR=1 FL=1
MGGTLPSNVIFDECFNAVRGLPSCGQGNADIIFAQLKSHKQLAVHEFNQATKVTGDVSPDLHKTYELVRIEDPKGFCTELGTDSYFTSFCGGKTDGTILPSVSHDVPVGVVCKGSSPSKLASFQYTTLGRSSASCPMSCYKTRGGKRHSNKSKKIEKSAGQINIFFGNLSSWSVHAEDYVNGLTDDIILLAETSRLSRAASPLAPLRWPRIPLRYPQAPAEAFSLWWLSTGTANPLRPATLMESSPLAPGSQGDLYLLTIGMF